MRIYEQRISSQRKLMIPSLAVSCFIMFTEGKVTLKYYIANDLKKEGSLYSCLLAK